MGDELTLGQTLDTNSRWLSARLLELGIVTVEHATVPDDLGATGAAFKRLSGTVDLLISTGGLGPTADDLCRAALAAAMDDRLVVDGEALEQISRWFAGRGRVMMDINRVQAMRPSRGTCLPNGNGTAPGLHGRIGECDVFCLPGPAREMMPMFEECVRVRLAPVPGRTVATRVLHTYGIGESELATRLGSLMERDRMPLVGTTASGGVVSIRIRYEGLLQVSEASAVLDRCAAEARRCSDPFVFGENETTLPAAVLTMLVERGQTLAAVESCTGGLLGAMITEVPGSSKAFVGGWITYSNEMKTAEVGVPADLLAQHGAVSGEVAAAMARGGLEKCGADYCLSITGIAGPDGGTEAKPVGLVFVTLASRQGAADVRRFRMTGDRESIREWSARSALAVLRMHLIGKPGTRLLRQAD